MKDNLLEPERLDDHPQIYYDRHLDANAVKIMPGQYYITRGNTEAAIVTVLGSCVAVCLRDPVTGYAGMNHFMLPMHMESRAYPAPYSARYGSYAMELLTNALLKKGALRENLEAKVFGGASVMDALTVSAVGERNVSFILNYLATENIRVLTQDLLGKHARKIYYYPLTGRVDIRHLPIAKTISRRDEEYARILAAGKPLNDIKIF